jgi:hypothetical protein
MSVPMIAVTGAARVFSTLPGETQPSSFSLAAAERTKTIRAGDELAEVGPHFHEVVKLAQLRVGYRLAR